MSCESTPTAVAYNAGRPTELDCPAPGLPLTGLDLALLVAAGLIAMALGLLLRQRRSSA